MKMEEMVKKIKEAQAGKIDLSSGEDLSIAVMNLISLEEHLFFTASKTGKKDYLKLLDEIREMRKELLGKIVKNPEGEVWCQSKHLLSASMRLFEVGTKLLNQKKEEEAQDCFSKSYRLYSLFWGLNLHLVDIDNAELEEPPQKGAVEKVGDLLKKIIDCCKE